MTSIAISSGHGKHIRGASGYIDEVDEARKVVEAVAVKLLAAGVTCKTFHDDTSHSQNENLNTIVNWHNKQSRTLDVSVHFNAYETTSKPMGVEVLYVTQSTLASELSKLMADAGHFINRGGKKRTDLFFLNNTSKPAILIETCFVDSKADVDLYHQHYDAICRAIAEKIGGVSIPGEHPPPLEPEPPEIPEGEVVEVTITHPPGLTVEVEQSVMRHGDTVKVDIHRPAGVTVNVNMADEPTTPPDNQRGITASVFGGEDDYNTSAYDESLVLNDEDLYIALPDRIDGNRPRVQVINPETGKTAIAEILDVGPWMTDDPYWITGERPTAETCHNSNKPLPSGPHAGKIPGNPAGIDLSPALADALGIDGMGEVDWMFVEGDHVQRRLARKA